MSLKEILLELDKVVASLKKASSWNGSLQGVDAKKDDFVFELLCFFDVALSKNMLKAVVVARKDPKDLSKSIARWPKKPGDMKNFSYIKLNEPKNNNTIFKLCPGIKVKDKFGKDRAQDINLLEGKSSEAPVFQDLVACWDAKYVTNPASRMSDVAVSDFIQTFRCLGSPVSSVRWRQEVNVIRYKTSGLITNGKPSTEPDGVFSEVDVCETVYFPKNPATRP